MKRRDFMLIGALLLLAGLVWIGITVFRPYTDNHILNIYVDNELYDSYDLSENQEIAIGDGNRCQIKDGAVSMIWANCPDQTCVHTKEITDSTRSIICLPNRVVLEVSNES